MDYSGALRTVAATFILCMRVILENGRLRARLACSSALRGIKTLLGSKSAHPRSGASSLCAFPLTAVRHAARISVTVGIQST
eukprot:6195144-Pleurochrysis_carterae.AAC.3